MTLDEFKALKEGDRVRNPMSDSSGVVSGVEEYRGNTAVSVRWDGSSRPLRFSQHTTAWMHWTLEPTPC